MGVISFGGTRLQQRTILLHIHWDEVILTTSKKDKIPLQYICKGDLSRYRYSHYNGKVVVRASFHQSRNCYTDKTPYSYFDVQKFKFTQIPVKNVTNVYSKYHAYWWSLDVRDQGISKHWIDLSHSVYSVAVWDGFKSGWYFIIGWLQF